MESPESAALAWITRTLEDELREKPAMAKSRAETLHAIAKAYDVRVERLIDWLRVEAPGKTYSGAEFRRYAEALKAPPKMAGGGFLPPCYPD